MLIYSIYTYMKMVEKMASPRQLEVRAKFKEAVDYCKNPANRGGLTFQKCIASYFGKAGGKKRKKGRKRGRKKAKVVV